MAAVNGANGVNGAAFSFPPARFSRVPESISVPVAEEGGDVLDIEIGLDEEIQDDPTELCTLLESEHSAKTTWVTVAIAYAKHKKLDVAIEVLGKAISVFAQARADDRLSILNGMCWLYLLKCREAPRVKRDHDPEIKTKDFYIQAATSVLNDASRISPSYPPLFLARGVLYLLRASLQVPSTAGGPNAISVERMDTLKQAAKCFEDALRASQGKNLMAKMGKARVSYSMGKYPEALKGYQNILENSPGLIDPDPRIGIGCCFWQLGFKDDAAGAWQRSLDLNPKSKIALTLLGLHTLHRTANLPATDPSFASLTKKSITDYVAPSMKLDNKYPLTCATLSKWYNITKDVGKVETLSRRAIELTDVNAIASDGWYQLARKEHQLEDMVKAADFYSKSDQARGGDDRGYIPAKFGSAQMRVLKHDYDGAKFRLEKILQQQPIVEAQTLLGTLYAEDVFAAQGGKSSDDKSAELKKALKYLEDVQKAWKDPKRKLIPDPAVLLNLARLYEADHPEKSLKCLEEVEQIELDGIPEEDYPQDIEDEAELKNALRELLPPQLLNNMACFHYQAERYLRARELFQAALQGCVKAADRDESIDTDALVTSISYNLGRTYEAEGMLNEAKDVFEGLQKRHPNYIDAQIRLAYIALRQQPTDEGPRAVKELIKSHDDNLEVRALYGWYANKSKKRGVILAEDQEQRHYKHTLQKFDKHDTYSLTGMGNIHLTIAREMRRDTEQDKEKRRKMYERAVEFFNKVLELDPRNAYAAQGIAIALAEDKKDHSTSLQIFTKVKDTLKDFNVYMNLGHTYAELKQYARAIENYETALSKKPHDLNTLACLGRVWFIRGKGEQNLSHMKTALDYSQQALILAPNQNHFQFNVAFMQIQIAQLVYTLKDTQRTLVDVEEAQQGLDEAIKMFETVANSENPPYPKDDIIQRANMGRNTMANQLKRAHDKQKEYEDENASKLQAAREAREAEIKKREDEKRKATEEQAERSRKIMEERQKLEERDREYMERRREEERRRQELIDDSEVRKSERRQNRGKGGKRKKKGDMDDSETEAGGSDSDRPRRRKSASGTEGLSDEERPRTKKRKLARKSEPAGKYKSAEFVDDDDSDDADAARAPMNGDADAAPSRAASESDDETISAPRGGRKRVIDEDEDEDDEETAVPRANGDMMVADEEEDE
ncbi:protein required for normal CLN1 and CLN2 G1 cyclin expression [Kalmusia sp. IMI 367209]|nr:protein required for normal CLN1 and CLN2 G1 cyclin expression [Kalmusia sp. IMI 367209]